MQVDLRAALQQKVHHPLVAVAGGAYQRGAAVAVLQVDLRATLQQAEILQKPERPLRCPYLPTYLPTLLMGN